MGNYLRLGAVALGLFLWSAPAQAQCTGVFPAKTLCGNLGATAAPPKPFSASGTVIGPATSVVGHFATWANTTGTQLADFDLFGTANSWSATQTFSAIVATTADINGGTIDGTTIGASSAANGTFNTLTVNTALNVANVVITGGTINGTPIGGTTPAAGAFTTLSASSNSTVGGTLTVTGTAAAASIQVNEQSTPSTPASGKGIYYASSSGNPTFINDDGVVSPLGTVVQVVTATPYTANTNITTVIPNDDTVPLISEGTEVLTASITPTTTGSRILVMFSGWGTPAGSGTNLTTAVFRGSTNIGAYVTGANSVFSSIGVTIADAPASTSAQTYSIRIGPGVAGSFYTNGTSGGRFFGGNSSWRMQLIEVK